MSDYRGHALVLKERVRHWLVFTWAWIYDCECGESFVYPRKADAGAAFGAHRMEACG